MNSREDAAKHNMSLSTWCLSHVWGPRDETTGRKTCTQCGAIGKTEAEDREDKFAEIVAEYIAGIDTPDDFDCKQLVEALHEAGATRAECKIALAGAEKSLHERAEAWEAVVVDYFFIVDIYGDDDESQAA